MWTPAAWKALLWAVVSLHVLVDAHPAMNVHQHKHRRDVPDWVKTKNWSDMDNYKGVVWTTVNYGQPPAPTPTPVNAQPPAQAAPSSVAAAQPAASPATPSQPATPAQQPNNKVAPAQSSPASSSASAPATQSKTGGGSGGKRGIAYNYNSPSVNAFNSFSQITWAYNWDSNPAPGAGNKAYIPLLFSDSPDHTGQWDSNAKAATQGGTRYLMSFNEPDMAAPQANMPVERAVAAFQKYMSPHASDSVFLGSPSVSNGVGTNPATGQPMGMDWLKPFLQQCSNCPISFAPVHWYGCTNGCPVENDVSAFKQQMQQAMNTAQLANGKKIPIWITEFQRLGDGQDQFLEEILPWLDSQAQVEKYAYFMDTDGILAQGSGVSALGQKYGA